MPPTPAATFSLAGSLPGALDAAPSLGGDPTACVAELDRHDEVVALARRAAEHFAKGDARAAVDLLEAALRLDPRSLLARRNLAPPLLAVGRVAEALAAARVAVELEPLQASTALNLAAAELASGRWSAAVASARRALTLGCDAARGRAILGRALAASGDLAGASAVADALLASGGEDPGVLAALASILPFCGRLREAAEVQRRRVASDPTNLEAIVNLGAVLRDLGRLDDAISVWRRAIEVDPGCAEAAYNSACTELLAGRYTAGWSGYELRWRANDWPVPGDPSVPLWDGRPLGEGTLLVHHEQGLGDTLQFLRLVQPLRAMASTVVLDVQPALRRLIASSPLLTDSSAGGADDLEHAGAAAGGRVVLACDAEPCRATACIPLLSVPGRLGLDDASLRTNGPYLRAEPDRVVRWRRYLDAMPSGLRVGLAWRGNLDSPAERGRSTSLATLTGLLSVPATRFVVLQKDCTPADLEAVPEPIRPQGPPEGLDSGPDAFVDTAAILAGLDLVVTTDTSLAHLAGAMGRPVWLLLRHSPDWRWGVQGERTPWYPSMRLFRQPAPGDWDSVVAAVRRVLVDLSAAHAAHGDHAGSAAAFERALALHRAGQADEAVPYYRDAVRAAPSDARRLGLAAMAMAHHGERPDDETVELQWRAVQAAPFDPDQHANLAVLLRRRGAPWDARTALRQALALAPGHWAATVNLARLDLFEGRIEEAVGRARTITGRKEAELDALLAASRVLTEAKRCDESMNVLDRVCAAAPDHAAARIALGLAQLGAGQLDRARRTLARGVALDPGNGAAWSDLGVALRQAAEPALAAWAYRMALRRRPGDPGTWANLGIAMDELDRPADSQGAFVEALKLRPDYAEARMSLGMTMLREGRFAEGQPLYESRLAATVGVATKLPARIPEWRGGDPAGLRFLLVAEQGFGDAIHFVRYAGVLKAAGAASVTLACRDRIATLMARAHGVDAVLRPGEPFPDADVAAHLMSLPRLLGTTVATIPARVPYLELDASPAAAWADRLAARPGLRVGIVWQGNPDPTVDHGRSLRLEDFRSLAGIAGVRLIALQHGADAAEASALGVEIPDPALDTGADGFLDTAALITNLDLVISVDTAVAHLAGALGRPVWLLLRNPAEWRWLQDRRDTPWYPTARLFRAPPRGRPVTVMGEIAAELAALRDGDRSRLVPATGPAASRRRDAPVDADAALLAARQLRRSGDATRAAAVCHDALAFHPERTDLLELAGVLALQRDEHALAELMLREVTAKGPVGPEVLSNLAVALKHRGNYAEAEKVLRITVAAAAGFAGARVNLANVLRDTHRPEEAETQARAAVAAEPESSSALRCLGNVLRDLGRIDESVQCLTAACARSPADPEIAIDHAHALLAAGRWREGFRVYEDRWKSSAMRRPFSAAPLWDGQAADSGTLLVHTEQGLGDTLQFIRFLGPLRARWSGPIVLAAQRALLPLLASLTDPLTDVTAIPSDAPWPAHDAVVALMSLPMVLALENEAELPRPPYLAADPARVAAWRERLGDDGRPMVGLVWQGNPRAKADRGRSLSIEHLERLLAVDGIRFVSLQKEHGLAGLGRMRHADRLLRLDPDLDAGPEAFADTAAVIAGLDLVVSCDTAVAHLTGALGRPLWLMLKRAADWRWQIDRSDSPWYPTARLFRQPAHADWHGVVDRVAAALRAQIARPASKERVAA